MKTIITRPPSGGTIKAIPSKSAAHRLLICACLSGLDIQGVCENLSEDLKATTECLLALRDVSERDAAGTPVLNCRESGSTLRFLLPLSAVLSSEAFLEGSERLMNRPLKELEEQLCSHGCTIKKENGKIHISGRLRGGMFTLPGDVSSQYISGLLFALPLLYEDSEIRVSGGLQSRPYVEMTTDALKQANIMVQANYGDTESVFRIKGNQKYELGSFGLEDIEGDWSNGAFWLVADALGAKISCVGLREDSVQGDRRIKELIDTYSRPGEWIVDVGQTPDLVPEIALLAMARKDGELTKIINGKRLRMKESDRIESVVTTVNHLGGNAKATEDEIHIVGTGNRKRRPLALIDSFNDHRIVMMASVGALLCDGPIEIMGSQAVRKSYPGFFEDYKSLGGRVLTE